VPLNFHFSVEKSLKVKTLGNIAYEPSVEMSPAAGGVVSRNYEPQDVPVP
jgi:hypothetical protein